MISKTKVMLMNLRWRITKTCLAPPERVSKRAERKKHVILLEINKCFKVGNKKGSNFHGLTLALIVNKKYFIARFCSSKVHWFQTLHSYCSQYSSYFFNKETSSKNNSLCKLKFLLFLLRKGFWLAVYNDFSYFKEVNLSHH